MKTYKVMTPSGFETEIQANNEDEIRRYGFIVSPAPETRAKAPANKARKATETKEA